MPAAILVIDDFASVRLYHTSFLTRKGYDCHEASDGALALDQLHSRRFDLVILDMMMPGTDGTAFASQLNADPLLAAIPVLVITSEPALAHNVFSDSRRPVSILCKPVIPSALLQSVQTLLHRAASLDATVAHS